MTFVLTALFALFLGHSQATVDQNKLEVNPIRKIVGMLQDMQKELEHEADNEAELFEKAMCTCESGEKSLTNVIETSAAETDRLTNKIEEETAESDSLAEELKQDAYSEAPELRRVVEISRYLTPNNRERVLNFL